MCIDDAFTLQTSNTASDSEPREIASTPSLSQEHRGQPIECLGRWRRCALHCQFRHETVARRRVLLLQSSPSAPYSGLPSGTRANCTHNCALRSLLRKSALGSRWGVASGRRVRTVCRPAGRWPLDTAAAAGAGVGGAARCASHCRQHSSGRRRCVRACVRGYSGGRHWRVRLMAN